jgi:hypothetical protein
MRIDIQVTLGSLANETPAFPLCLITYIIFMCVDRLPSYHFPRVYYCILDVFQRQ